LHLLFEEFSSSNRAWQFSGDLTIKILWQSNNFGIELKKKEVEAW